MRRPHFWPGVAFAAVAAVGTALFVAGLTPLLGTIAMARFIVPLLAFAYLLFLLSRTDSRVGRATALIAWVGAAMAVWLWVDSLAMYLLLHVSMLWLIRALYFHSGVLPALLDGGLFAVGILCAFGTVLKTDSAMLGIWVFFLMQALFSLIPNVRRGSGRPEKPARETFGDAEARAEAALTQLIARSSSRTNL